MTAVYLAAVRRCPALRDVARATLRQVSGSGRVGLFVPLLQSSDDATLRVLRSLLGDPELAAGGVTLNEFLRADETALARIVAAYVELAARCDTVIVVGSDYSSPLAPVEFGANATIAANLGAAMVLVADDADVARVAIQEAGRRHAVVSGVLYLGSGREDLGVPTQRVELASSVLTRSFRLSSDLLEVPGEPPMTPLRFEGGLLRRARAVGQHIVLPEGDEERILRAAHRLLAEKTCRLTLLGDAAAVKGRAKELGLNLDAAEVVDPATSPLRERFAARYAELRAKKGVTLEQARERVADVSYFGTMMVLEGIADGMVSGAVNTTAHTIRPSLEVVKTRPGVSVVSSVFLMCLADRVLVFGDCAVNPNPNAAQLADIAISSAETARAFGIEPRVAMLSYATGDSGSGPDVDLVVAATEEVRSRAPGLAVDGPLQYDAAVDPDVGTRKRPGSPVAGRATVLIFPDLSAGNAAYKAVQRSANALAIGPVLQGLNKPVNDLSRGALVDDIVNTVAITAIQGGAA